MYSILFLFRASNSNKEEEKDPKRVCSDNDIKVDHVEEVYVEKEVSASQVVKERVTVEKKEKDMEDVELPNVESLKVNSGSSSDSRPFGKHRNILMSAFPFC